MLACGACGAPNPDEFRFCGSCGMSLDRVPCRSCGFANPRGQRFCGQCGSALTEDASPPGATSLARLVAADERKLATVLFADVVGFTSLSETSDPETVARTVDAAFRRMAEVVVFHGGTVDKYLGDSLMALFGVPQAHDDDAERAVAAGLAMRELGGDLAFSIGINTGEVMVTAVGRDGDVTVIGDTVNVAARLEKTAGAGELLIGPLTAELAGERVVLRERQPVMLKGKRDPVPVWEAIALRPYGPALRRGDAKLPLIGRDDELAFLRAQWKRAVRSGRSSVVLLTGEAGSGKARLVEELAADVEREGLVVRARYPAYGGLGGPRVAADIIGQLGPVGDTEVDSRVRSIAGELHPSLRSIDPGAMRQEQQWALRRLLELKAREQPLLIAVDDLHRSGESMLELVSGLMARVVDVPILLLLMGRPEPAEWLGWFPSATTLRLGPLSAEDTGTLADFMVCDLPLSASAREALVGWSGGNPLHLRELLTMLRARGGLVAESGEYRLAGGLTLPPSLQAILAARLDALPPLEKAALQHVAVLGDAATAEQVEAFGPAGAGAALESLVATGLLHQGSEGCFDVVDPLLREVAYETLPRHVRGDRHRRAAVVTTGAVDRARHLERAAGYLPEDTELASEAAQALAAAGVELLGAYRFADGSHLLRQAVDLGYRDAGDLLSLVRCLGDAGHVEDAEAVLALVPPEPDDPAMGAERVHVAAVLELFRDPERALGHLEEAGRRWAEVGDRGKEAWAYANRGVALFNLGRMRPSTEALERAAVLFRDVGDRQGEMRAVSFLALVRPEDPRAVTWMGDALRHAEEAGDRSGQLAALVSLAWHHYFRARLAGDDSVTVADGFAARLAAVAVQLGTPDIEVHGLCLRSSLARLSGRIEEATALADLALRRPVGAQPRVESLRDAVAFAADLAAGRESGPVPNLAESPDPVVAIARVIEAEALILAGRAAEAWSELEAYEHSRGMGPLESVGRLVEPMALVMLGRVDEARPMLERSLAAAEALDAHGSATAARGLLAEALLRSGGDARDAAAVLGPVPVTSGVGAAFVLRARALMGDTDAAAELEAFTQAFHAPGLGLEAGHGEKGMRRAV